MKSKILKIVLGLILFSVLFITVSSAATTVKEDVQDYDDIVYIIGSTRFDSDVIITAQRAANAGVSEAKRLVAMGKADEIENLNLKTYCYIPDFDEWYEIQEEAKSLNKEEIKNIEENLNIFFVNNEEKTLEIEFDGVIDENSIVGPTNATPEIKNKKIIVPATWIEGFQFTSEGTKVEVKLSEDNNGKVEELDKPVIKKQPTMTASIPSSVYVGDDLEFTVSFKGNDFENENVKININTQYSGTSMEVNPIEKIEYYDEATKNWKEVDIYNQNNGLKMALKTGDVKFRAILNCEGNYKIQVNAMLEDSYIMLSSEQTNVNATMKENVVAKVGAKYYQDLTEAVNNANKSTVKLLKDITITERLNIINKEVVLDLNQNTINIEGELSRITAGGTSKLTIQNGNVVSNGDYALQAQDDATLNVLDNVKVTTKSYGITVWDNAIVNYNGEIVITGDGYGISGNGGDASNTTININGGKITAVSGAAIYHPQTGALNINDGELTADTVVGIKAGTLNVLGGTLTATGEKNAPEKKENGFNLTGDVVYIEENPAYRNNIHVNITGGTLTSTNGYIMQELNVTIGTEKERIPVVTGNYETRTMLENNVTTFTETSEAALETAKGTKYLVKDFSKVMKDATLSGGKVKLLKDIEITDENDRVSLEPKETTKYELDLNGKTITTTIAKSLFNVSKDAELTLKNGTMTKTVEDKAPIVQVEYTGIANIEKDLTINSVIYGVTIWEDAIVNFEGTINLTGAGYAISGNGSYVQNTTLNILGGEINAPKGHALYLPQIGTTTISGGKLTANTVVGIKSGTLNITGGELIATGTKVELPSPTYNGVDPTGDAIFVELNNSYSGNVVVNYNAGKVTSENAYVLREYSVNGQNATINGLVDMAGENNIRIFDFVQ
ncbi:MAG: hypothetical protein UGE22_04730 [Clostridia bacterium]|nr:hypothetical protein [Clostridia bacterium]